MRQAKTTPAVQYGSIAPLESAEQRIARIVKKTAEQLEAHRAKLAESGAVRDVWSAWLLK